MLVGESKNLLCNLIFAGKRRAEHGGIVGVERDHDAMIKITFCRMIDEVGAKAGAEVAGEADFYRNLALAEFFDEIGIMEGSEPVANAFDAQIKSAPYGFGRASLAGVSSQAHAMVGGPGVAIAEDFGRTF